jgi:hypothetical protein
MNALGTKWLLGALGCLVWIGCTDISSSNLKTQGMTAHFAITADGTGATTSAAILNVDTNATDFVQLVSGDALVTNVASQSQPMSANNVAGVITYTAGFTGQDAAGTPYTVAFNRSAGNASAPSSTVTIPQPFTVQPLAAQTFSRANDNITITYGAAQQTDSMSWSIAGNCLNILAGNSLSGDPGTFVIAKGALVSHAAGGDQNCQATFTLSRSRLGTLDPAFGGGSIDGIQQRTLTFTSTP